MFDLLSTNPLQFVMLVVAMLFSLAFHEFSHAWAATSLGDDTPRDRGRLTINPLAHIDLFGLLLFLTIGFGWGRPVPFNPDNLKYRKWGSALVGLAGPAANFTLAFVCALVLKFALAQGQIDAGNAAVQFFADVVLINALWGVFNLIPIPPLDGSKFFLSLLPESWEDMKIQYERIGPFVLLLLLILDRTSGIGFFDAGFGFVLQAVNVFIAK